MADSFKAVHARVRAAIKRRDLAELNTLLTELKPVVSELEQAVAQLGDPVVGLRIPYGPPIQDAAMSGDLARMKATAEAARRVLYPIEFAPVHPEKQREVASALAELEAKIRELESPR